MRILLVNDYGGLVGGAETSLDLLRHGLRERGHDARLFTSSAYPEGIPSVADYECFGTTSRYRVLLQSANPSAAYSLRKVLREFRPEVVHVKMFLTQLSPLVLPLVRRVPSVYHVVWYRPVCPLGTRRLPDGSRCRVRAGVACYENACLPLRDWLPLMGQLALWRHWRDAFDRVVANSETTRRVLVANGIEPVEVIYAGVASRPPRPPLEFPPTVAYAGRLVPEKGVDFLLRSFAQVVAEIPDARLLIAGEGQERGRLERLARELGTEGSISMLGHLPGPELERVLDTAWAQAIPSLWDEPFGIVALEAMMRGTAVVGSETGGFAEVVRHGETGLLVPPGDVPALARALLAVLGDRETAEALGQAGHRVAESGFREAQYVERFLHLYRTLLTRR
jgi:glycosyltransferase involved in cell wall biosynthesis